ncbi:MAG: glucose 1-dehydrogenase [Sphingorhabdus sp.]
MSTDLEGKVVIVTGGGTGIGRTTAEQLAAIGASVVVSDINEVEGDATVESIKSNGGNAEFFKCDVSDSHQVSELHQSVILNHKRIDGAFNNAGISGRLDLATIDYTEELFDRVIAVNLKSVWLCMKEQISQMLKQGYGSIVNNSSVAGLVGIENSAYTASKHGVVGLTKSAAIKHAKDNIRVNAVCPGYVYTPTTAPAIDGSDKIKSALIGKLPVGRLGEPDEIAAAAIWLLSDASSFVTGHAMPVDGGMIAK